MAKIFGIYKCNVCGNQVQVVHAGGGTLVCCGHDMELLVAKTHDEGEEKHVPVIEIIEDGIFVKVGSVSHPMEPTHYIEWIELTVDGQQARVILKPGDKPEALFHLQGENVSAQIFCNIHGLWKSI